MWSANEKRQGPLIALVIFRGPLFDFRRSLLVTNYSIAHDLAPCTFQIMKEDGTVPMTTHTELHPHTLLSFPCHPEFLKKPGAKFTRNNT